MIEIISDDRTPIREEWQRIATAYQEAIVPNAPYQEMLEKIVQAVGKSKRVVDLGCGTGAALVALLHGGNREVVGVDSSPAMLEVAKRVLEAEHPHADLSLYHQDATGFNEEKGFDAAISTNVLFTLAKPMRYLDNAYSLLQTGGRLVLSTPVEKADMGELRENMEKYYEGLGVLEEKMPFIDTVWSVNTGFDRFTIYPADRLERILVDFIGFDSIESSEQVYGTNRLIVAKKGKHKHPSFRISDADEDMEKGFALRYHWLAERYGYAPHSVDASYKDACDGMGVGAFAFEGDKVISFLNYVDDTLEPPFANPRLLSKVRARLGKVGFFNGYYTMMTRASSGVGGYLHSKFLLWLKDQGVNGVLTEANPRLKDHVRKFGGEVIGEPFICTGAKGTEVIPVLFDLTCEGTLELCDELERTSRAKYRPFTEVVYSR